MISSLRLRLVLLAMIAALGVWQVSLAHDFGGGTGPGNPPGDPPNDPPCGGEPGEPSDPVDLGTGAEYFSETDVRLLSRVPMGIERGYNSQAEYDSPVGYGWDFNYNMRAYRFPDGSVVIRVPGGERRQFLDSGGAFQPPPDAPTLELIDNLDGTLTMVDSRGVDTLFDLQGRVSRQTYHDLGWLEFTYDAAGKLPLLGVPDKRFPADATPKIVAFDYRLTLVSEYDNTGVATGNFLQFGYDGATGRMTSITDQAGTTVTYGHDALGNLITVNDDTGMTLTYVYGDPLDNHNLTIFEVTGSADCVRCAGTFVNAYDAEDRVIRQEHNNGIIDVVYTVPGVQTDLTYTVTDDQGAVVSVSAERFEFDADGNVTLEVDAFGNETRFTRNAAGYPTRQEFWENQDVVGLVMIGAIDTTYDSFGRTLTKVYDKTTGETITEEYTYLRSLISSIRVYSSLDPTRKYGRNFEYDLGPFGVKPQRISQMKRVTAVDGAGNATAFSTTQFQYATNGNLERIIYPNGDTYVNEFNFKGLVTRRYNLANPARDVVFTYDDRGFPTSRTDPNGGVQTTTYDELGRLVQMTNALGETTLLTYDDLTLTRLEEGIVGGQPGRVTTYTYLSSKDPSLLQSVVRDGQIIATYTYDSNGRRLSAMDALGQGTTYTYDARGDLASITRGGQTQTFTYDMMHNVTEVADNVNGDVDYLLEHDFLGNRLSMQRPGSAPTVYTYDAVDNAISLTDPLGRTTNFIFDLQSQLIELQRPLTNSEFRTWTPRGKLDSVIQPSGKKIEYNYDPFGRIDTLQWYASAGAATPDRTISFSYDLNDNLLGYSDSVLSPGMQLNSFTYDALNRRKTVTSDLHSRSIEYFYDSQGFRDRTSLTDGGDTYLWTYGRDAFGRVTSISAPTTLGSTENYTLSHYSSGRIRDIVFPNGFKQEFTYHPDGRVQSARNLRPNSTELAAYSYTYDGAGNVLSVLDSLGTNTFGYDVQYRLTSAAYSDGTSESFTYDDVGNRVTHTTAAGTATYTHNARNQITAISGSITGSFLYDPDGNMTQQAVSGEPTVTLGYDHFSRLVSRSGDINATYDYDPFNRLVTGTEDGVFTRYLYDDSDVLVEIDNLDATRARYHGGLGVDDMVGRFVPSGSQSEYYLTSTLGSIDYVLDGSGVLNSYRYEAFGGESAATEATDSPYGFTGRRSPDKQLYNLRSRSYSARWGRFVQEDPLRFLGGSNFYSYVHNTPLSAIDPFGLLTIVVPGTWWSEDAWNDSAPFVEQVGRTFGETPIILGKDDWSGDNSNGARQDAAKALKDLIDRKRKAGEPVNVVAHSHGGNVAAIASQNTQIDNLVTLGTPVRGDYSFNQNNIGSHVHGYSRNDLVQRNGDLDAWHGVWQFFTPPAGRTVPGATNVDTGVDTGPLDSHTDLWRDLNTWKDKIVPELPPGTDCENR